MIWMYRLRIVPSEGPAYEHSVRGEVVRIGRAADCELCLDDPFLSRYHARLVLDGDGLKVEDLGSANGTYVNGERISAPIDVGEGDVVRVSGTELSLVTAPSAEAPPERPAAAAAGVTMLRSMEELMAEVEGGGAAAVAGEAPALQRAADRLRLLNELHEALARPIELSELLDLVLDGAFEHLHPERAVVLLRGDDGEVTVAAERSLREDDDPPLVSQTLIEEVMEKGQAAIAFDTQSDERFAGSQSILAAGAKSLLAAPLQDSESCVGMIVLSSRLQVRAFTEEDMPLLVSLASVAAMRIRNLSLAEEAAERERLESELTMARRIQESLLPRSFPELAGLEVFGTNAASRWVSGDYFQIVARGEEECVLAVADVCGKGMAAALLTASLEAVWAALIEAGLPPEEICARANNFLYQRTPPDKFATAFLATVDAAGGGLRYVNAGHNPPMLLRASGELQELEATGFPFGMVPDAEYEFGELELGEGDLLVCFTDGIVEAMNPEGEQFQTDRMAEAFLTRRDRPLDDLAASIDRDLAAFVRGVPFVDDRTLVLLRRTAA